MTIKNIAGYTYEANIFFYYQSSLFTPRPFILLYWGSSPQGDTLFYSGNSSSDTATTQVKYTGTHTYPGGGTYIVSCIDSFRVANLQNITNSSNEKMYLWDTLNINPFLGSNNSAISLSSLVDSWQCCNWIYNPSSTDSDGDSLSYSLVNPFTTNYTFPPASINSVTGDMTFNPTATGHYAFCMNIVEWRKINTTYYKIGSTFRQMLIYVNSLLSVNENNFPQTVSLFPNPFNTQTVLQTDNLLYNATLTVDNCFGQTVAQIKNISGRTVTFSRDNLASGLYFVRLTTPSPLQGEGRGEVIATGKLVITD